MADKDSRIDKERDLLARLTSGSLTWGSRIDDEPPATAEQMTPIEEVWRALDEAPSPSPVPSDLQAEIMASIRGDQELQVPMWSLSRSGSTLAAALCFVVGVALGSGVGGSDFGISGTGGLDAGISGIEASGSQAAVSNLGDLDDVWSADWASGEGEPTWAEAYLWVLEQDGILPGDVGVSDEQSL